MTEGGVRRIGVGLAAAAAVWLLAAPAWPAQEKPAQPPQPTIGPASERSEPAAGTPRQAPAPARTEQPSLWCRVFRCGPATGQPNGIDFARPAGVASAAPRGGDERPTLLVLNFDAGAVRTSAAAVLGSNDDVGAGLSDLVVQELIASNAYRVIDVASLQAALKEQGLSAGGSVNSEDAVRIGKLVGADIVVMGSLTQFGRERRTTRGIGGILGGALGSIGTRRETDGVVSANVRVVNAATGEIVRVFEGEGKFQSRSAAPAGVVRSEDAESIANAVKTAAASTATQVIGVAPSLLASRELARGTAVEIGQVAAVNGSTVTVTLSAQVGLKAGEPVVVTRATRSILDPVSKALGSTTEPVGVAQVTEVRERTGTVTVSGGAAVRVGDIVVRVQ